MASAHIPPAGLKNQHECNLHAHHKVTVNVQMDGPNGHVRGNARALKYRAKDDNGFLISCLYALIHFCGGRMIFRKIRTSASLASLHAGSGQKNPCASGSRKSSVERVTSL
jgi:hypothetical protein